MASFIGTFEEFIKYINPRVKNVVNSISRAYKQEVGRCEHCNSVEATLTGVLDFIADFRM